eukprot:gnl/TRDRNA2_/TRDRNA2_166427_c0_seq1.p1 gnl/TRDRNA2_/TRDRNA2_166427_c0~~gnl/TRDRNA2_/TRDRNA2_166427_c0_seq1.p1  ORF type:complete len:114 (+),score=19.68 gnl/TRDRNA2_/TRDRNA2_166427_c0_seq1:1-342(+)
MTSGNVALQSACMGAAHVLCCRLNTDETDLVSFEKVATHDIIESRRNAFTYQGQRVRLLLERILEHMSAHESPGKGSLGCIYKLTFDQGKAPVIVPAPADICVLPVGFPSDAR